MQLSMAIALSTAQQEAFSRTCILNTEANTEVQPIPRDANH